MMPKCTTCSEFMHYGLINLRILICSSKVKTSSLHNIIIIEELSLTSNIRLFICMPIAHMKWLLAHVQAAWFGPVAVVQLCDVRLVRCSKMGCLAFRATLWTAVSSVTRWKTLWVSSDIKITCCALCMSRIGRQIFVGVAIDRLLATVNNSNR